MTDNRLDEVAIIGMVCRFPGANDIHQFWRNLIEGVDSISFFTDEELLASGVPAGRIKHPDYVNARGILEDIEMFDPSFFGMTPREAQVIDPQQRLFLESAAQALESAGYNPDTYSGAIGVYGGTGMSEYLFYIHASPELRRMGGGFATMLGNDKDYLTTRVSYKLNLKGPSINVNTACSTSLVAVALACQSLLNAECDIALAGGVSIFFPQKVGHFHQEGAINSPDGHCRPFDAKAEGTVGGNGVGIVVLKRLAEALQDGDYIYAVIKGSAVNNDGSGKVGYTAPSINGQAEVIAMAQAMANVEAESISYVEAHGTATPLGDPIEIAALTKVFGARTERRQFCAVGSVKSNIGHLDAAAGVAGLIKTALALQHQVIPASLHYEQANPKIDFAQSPFFVNARTRAWETNGQPRRAGVSSFGIGGTNAHLVLEEAPAAETSGLSRRSQLLVLSAKTAGALEQASEKLAQYLEQHAEVNLADVAYSYAVGRRAFEHRRVVVCGAVSEAIASLRTVASAAGAERVRGAGRVWSAAPEPKYRPVHFLFSGQGSQDVNMGRQLYESQRVYRETVDRCATVVAAVTGLDLRRVLYPAAGEEAAARAQLKQTGVTQPALFITEYALVQQWAHWGVKPQGMLGHSVGEYVAACVAGVLSEEDALRLVAVRGALMQQLPAGGAMLAVGLGESEARAVAGARVSVAALNGAELTVLSGAWEALAAVEQELSEQGVWSRRLETSHAFHSRLMEPMLEEYRAVLAGVELREPKQAYVSSVTGAWIEAAQVRAVDYWVAQVREPVRFWAGLQELQRGGESVVVEVGPGEGLSVLARAVWGAGAVVAPTLGVERAAEQQSEEQRVSAAVGQVWLGGVEIDWSNYYSEEQRVRLPLPTYPFQRQRCLLEIPDGPVNTLPTTNTQVTQTSASVHTREHSLADAKEKEIIMSIAQQSAVIQVSRQDHLCSILKTTWGNLMGVAPEKLDPHATFFELGVDSLLLIQVSQSIRATFDLKIPFRRLMEEFTTLNSLATHLDETLPSEKFRPQVLSTPEIAVTITETVTLPEVTTAHASATEVLCVAAEPHQNGAHRDQPAIATTSSLEGIIGQQIQLMSSQLDLLRGSYQTGQVSTENRASAPSLVSTDLAGCGPQTAPLSTPSFLSVAPNAVAVPEAGNGKAADLLSLPVFVPFQSIKPGPRGGLNARQQKHLDALIVRYNKRTASSKRHTAFHRPHLSDNRALLGFRLLWKELVYPIVGKRSLGSRIWDIDGNEYIDLTMGFGVHLFGHSPSFVMEAIEQQLKQGIQLGPQSELAGETAALLSELTGMQRMAFVNSGTEAVMSAMRLARAVTGRTRIASFAGSYHGTFDGTLGRLEKDAAGHSRTIPITQGIPPHMVEDLLILPYDKEESLEILRAEAGTLAAVLVEPVQSRRPDIQPKAFLQELRNITTNSHSALIFDDMITGFRIHPGGTQGYFGIQADIATYGKLIGGGLPIGVIAGKPEYLDAIDGGTWDYGDGSYPIADQTIFAGTFCKSPLSMAASRAVLRHLRASGAVLQESLNQRATVFVDSLNALLSKNEVPIKVVNFGSLLRFLLVGGQQHMELFFYHLIDKGVFIWEGRTAFLSTAHTDEDLQFIIRAFEQTIEEMRAGGFLPETGAEEVDPNLVMCVPVSVPVDIADSPLVQPVVIETGSPVPDSCISATEAQQQLWVLAKMDADASRAYNESMSFSIHGAFDTELMRRSLNQVIARHDALHSIFSADGQSLIIQPAEEIIVPLHDLTSLLEIERERETAVLIAQQAGGLFDLSQGPLVRACFIKLKPDHHLFVLTIHHAVFDGWSSSILLQELHAFYMGEKRGSAPQLPKAGRLGQFVQWQADQEQTGEVSEAETYWTEQYGGEVPVLRLPSDRARPVVQTYRGARAQRELSPSVYCETKDASVRQGSTLFMMLLAAFNLLLHRLTGQDDVIVGIHSAGQSAIAEGGHLIGHCINLLPLRSKILVGQTFEQYLNTLKGQMLDAYEHQSYPFSKLIKKLHRRRDPSRAPLVEAVFNVDRSATGLNLFGADVEISTNHTGFSKWELSWNVIDLGNGFVVECDYNADLYDPQMIQHWIGQYEMFLSVAAKDCSAPLTTLEKAATEVELKQRAAKIKNLKSLNLQKLKKVQRGAAGVVS